ncbi:MAG TPA: SCP2 sterol-binding domain-containing protein [Paenalcaligenes sp.]|nr:SCP2 sterol-binding domain-containing protein [Paenalcaligenes sp.]
MEAVFNRINTLLPPFLQPQTMVAKGVNFLLLRNPWAMQRLAAYAGRRLSIEWGAQNFQFVVTEAGLLSAFQGDKQAVEVRLIVPDQPIWALGSQLLQQAPEQFAEQLRIEGDVGFARTLADLAGQLRWDAEADLARFTGDIMAVRMVQAGQGLFQWVQRLAVHVQDNFSEYLGHESEMLTHQRYWIFWETRRQALEAQLDRVEERLDRLESGLI